MKKIKFLLWICIVINLISCSTEDNLNPINSTYTIDSIVVYKITDTSNTFFGKYQPLNPDIFNYINLNSSTVEDTIIYKNTFIMGFYNDSLTVAATLVKDIFKNMYVKQPDLMGSISASIIFYNDLQLDSVLYADLTPNFGLPIKKRNFLCTYTNSNLDSIGVPFYNDDNATQPYNKSIKFNYNTYVNQKKMIGLDVNEFLYIDVFDLRFANYGFCLPYRFFMFDKKPRTLNTNCKNLLSKITRDGKQENISYDFDETYNNRIKTINVATNTTASNYIIKYEFYYKP